MKMGPGGGGKIHLDQQRFPERSAYYIGGGLDFYFYTWLNIILRIITEKGSK